MPATIDWVGMTVDALAANLAEFSYWVATAERLERARDTQGALTAAQIAAQLAWTQHAGVFWSARLEDLLRRIGGELSKEIPSSPSTQVLHVLTEAYGHGGHTRLVYRWVRAAPEFRHSVLLTRQRYALPGQLTNSIATQGGSVIDLLAITRNPVDRARILRSYASSAELVVLHVHPSDAISVAALQPEVAGPVAFLNHADHVFWLGGQVADRYLSLRPSAIALAVNRRAIPEKIQQEVPIPLGVPPRETTAPLTRQQLGIDQDALVLLTVAQSYKYGPGGSDFLALIEPVLATAPRTVLVAVGPESTGGWSVAAQRFPGRVRALGIRDATPLYPIADIYLDSHPFTSLTSMLEAAQCGVPVVTTCAWGPAARVLCADGSGLEHCVQMGDDGDSLKGALLELVESAAARADAVMRMREALQYAATFDWNHLVATLMQTGKVTAQVRETGPEPQQDELDRYLAASSSTREKGRAIRSHAVDGQLKQRLTIARRLVRTSPMDALMSLPDMRVHRQGGRLVRWLRSRGAGKS